MGGTACRAELVLSAEQSLQGVSSAGGAATAGAGDNQIEAHFLRLNLLSVFERILQNILSDQRAVIILSHKSKKYNSKVYFQVVVQARQPISLSCEGHRPVSWHTPAHQEKGPRLKISHSKNNRNKNKFISTISISTTVYKDTGATHTALMAWF